MTPAITLREAMLADIPRIEALIARSARERAGRDAAMPLVAP
jgi:hypothetical protein